MGYVEDEPDLRRSPRAWISCGKLVTVHQKRLLGLVEEVGLLIAAAGAGADTGQAIRRALEITHQLAGSASVGFPEVSRAAAALKTYLPLIDKSATGATPDQLKEAVTVRRDGSRDDGAQPCRARGRIAVDSRF